MSEQEMPAPEVVMEAYYHYFTFDEVKALFVQALEGRAEFFDDELRLEDLKGAGNRGRMDTLRWAAREMRSLADVVRRIPDGEMRERPFVFPTEGVEVEAEDGEPQTEVEAEDGEPQTEEEAVDAAFEAPDDDPEPELEPLTDDPPADEHTDEQVSRPRGRPRKQS